MTGRRYAREGRDSRAVQLEGGDEVTGEQHAPAGSLRALVVLERYGQRGGGQCYGVQAQRSNKTAARAARRSTMDDAGRRGRFAAQGSRGDWLVEGGISSTWRFA